MPVLGFLRGHPKLTGHFRPELPHCLVRGRCTTRCLPERSLQALQLGVGRASSGQSSADWLHCCPQLWPRFGEAGGIPHAGSAFIVLLPLMLLRVVHWGATGPVAAHRATTVERWPSRKLCLKIVPKSTLKHALRNSSPFAPEVTIPLGPPLVVEGVLAEDLHIHAAAIQLEMVPCVPISRANPAGPATASPQASVGGSVPTEGAEGSPPIQPCTSICTWLFPHSPGSKSRSPSRQEDDAPAHHPQQQLGEPSFKEAITTSTGFIRMSRASAIHDRGLWRGVGVEEVSVLRGIPDMVEDIIDRVRLHGGLCEDDGPELQRHTRDLNLQGLTGSISEKNHEDDEEVRPPCL